MQEMNWVQCVKYSLNAENAMSWIKYLFQVPKIQFFWEGIYFRRYVGSMVEGRMEGKGGLATGGGKGVKMATRTSTRLSHASFGLFTGFVHFSWQYIAFKIVFPLVLHIFAHFPPLGGVY